MEYRAHRRMRPFQNTKHYSMSDVVTRGYGKITYPCPEGPELEIWPKISGAFYILHPKSLSSALQICRKRLDLASLILIIRPGAAPSQFGAYYGRC
jgi:hypothetical protein